MSRSTRLVVFLLTVALSANARAQEKGDSPRLNVRRIFAGGEFEPEYVAIRWLSDSSAYVTLEPSTESSGGRDLVSHDPASGEKRVLVSAAELIPPRESAPLAVEDYAFSPDRSRLLVFTNSKRVWRTNSRGDYWVLDRAARELRKLGGNAAPSSLMHAKFAPGGSQVAYVRENNIYVEDLVDGGITKLTNSRSNDEINGTFDWVYEEEFGLRDGFRFSPDGKSIAYWQLDTRGVPEFPLVNNTDSLYPRITNVKYPKVGEKNASCRVGVVPSSGGATVWVEVPGDPRDNYIAYLEWALDGKQLVLQQLNRRQNIVRVMLANYPAPPGFDAQGKVRPLLQATTVLEDHDDAWIDLQDELPWVHGGREFLWQSERDGWRHLYRASRDGGSASANALRLVTAGDFDVIGIVGVDKVSDLVYFTASPKNATQRYLYRVKLDGTGMARISPDGQPGTHDVQLSPDGKWAIDRYSAFDVVPQTALVRLPEHKTVRMLADNRGLQARLKKLESGRSEFFRVDIGKGVTLDGWCILPPSFDSTAKYALLVHVYGEPAGQTVLDRWGGSNYLWHRMLAQNGYIVMSFDNRGTPAPRGRAWRKSVFHQIGILAPEDQAAAVRAVLGQRPISIRTASASGAGAGADR